MHHSLSLFPLSPSSCISHSPLVFFYLFPPFLSSPSLHFLVSCPSLPVSSFAFLSWRGGSWSVVRVWVSLCVDGGVVSGWDGGWWGVTCDDMVVLCGVVVVMNCWCDGVCVWWGSEWVFSSVSVESVWVCVGGCVEVNERWIDHNIPRGRKGEGGRTYVFWSQ